MQASQASTESSDAPLKNSIYRVFFLNQVNGMNNYPAILSKIPTEVRLVAVSKTKSVDQILPIYAHSQRHFGENYVKELLEKQPQLPNDINWHFIGPLQSNKAKVLVKGVPNLWCVESVASKNVATLLNKACQELRTDNPLNVFIQINTSGQECI